MEPRSFILSNLKPLERNSLLNEKLVVSNDNYKKVKEALEQEVFEKKKNAILGS
jgi:hypothetical protein